MYLANVSTLPRLIVIDGLCPRNVKHVCKFLFDIKYTF